MFFFFFLDVWHVRSYFPSQRANPYLLLGKAET